MNKIILTGIGTGTIVFGSILWVYIKKIKSKLKRFVLRHLGDVN